VHWPARLDYDREIPSPPTPIRLEGPPTAMIHVIANIELHAGTRADFLVEFRKLVPLVLAEEGCIEYGPAIDIPSGIGAQQPLRDDVAVVVEKWESLDHLNRHLAATHMRDYRVAVREMVIATKLYVLEPA
jgi:quinol monooxygenase YgiN